MALTSSGPVPSPLIIAACLAKTASIVDPVYLTLTREPYFLKNTTEMLNYEIAKSLNNDSSLNNVSL